jgi:probable rRNA maturation factor
MTADLSDVPADLRDAVEAALSAVGVVDGHLGVELVDTARIRELNREHRGRDAPTDVLAFPLDGVGPIAGPRELGDVTICPEHCTDVVEAAVHGTLHLCGMDHEADDGEMLRMQAEIMARLRDSPGMPGRIRAEPGSPVADAPREDTPVDGEFLR